MKSLHLSIDRWHEYFSCGVAVVLTETWKILFHQGQYYFSWHTSVSEKRGRIHKEPSQAAIKFAADYVAYILS
jgi:hypothetical protein